MRYLTLKRLISYLITCLLLITLSCANRIPNEALQLSKESLKNRQLQTRYFDTDERTLLSASAALLQDLGFNINESETKLGVIVCSKKRSAKSVGQIVGSVLLALFTGVYTPVDKEQLIRASLVTKPLYKDDHETSKCRTAVRITFQRIVVNTEGQITRRECINDPKIYQEFFDKLSQSLFLEANEI